MADFDIGKPPRGYVITLGDSTHYAQLFVDADGTINAANLIPSGGGGGGSVNEVDGGDHITTVNPTGPIVTVNLDLFTKDQIPFGKPTTGGDLDQSANLVFKKSAQELILNGIFFIPNDSSPGVTAEMLGNAGFIRVQETVIGGGAEIEVTDDSVDTGVFIAATGSTTLPSASVVLVADDQTSTINATFQVDAVINAGSGTVETRYTVHNSGYHAVQQFTESDKTLHFTIAGTSATVNNTFYRWDSNPLWNYDVGAMVNNGTYTIGNQYRYIFLAAAGVIPNFTVKFPATPGDGQVHSITAKQAVTAFTLNGNGNTVNNAPAALTQWQTISYMFDGGIGAWDPVT